MTSYPLLPDSSGSFRYILLLCPPSTGTAMQQNTKTRYKPTSKNKIIYFLHLMLSPLAPAHSHHCFPRLYSPSLVLPKAHLMLKSAELGWVLERRIHQSYWTPRHSTQLRVHFQLFLLIALESIFVSPWRQATLVRESRDLSFSHSKWSNIMFDPWHCNFIFVTLHGNCLSWVTTLSSCGTSVKHVPHLHVRRQIRLPAPTVS